MLKRNIEHRGETLVKNGLMFFVLSLSNIITESS